jgi:5'-3' exonuclease
MAKSFMEHVTPENPRATMIVDGLNLCFRWKHTPNYNNYREEFIRTVRSLASSYKCERIIIAADWGSSTYRKEICDLYKADRKEKYKDQTDEEREAFLEFFNEYEATMEEASQVFTVLRYKGVEADDIAAYLVKNRNEFNLEDIWLISSDGDWDLLVNEDTSRFTWRTRKEITVDNWGDHYDVTPEQFICYKVLMGDKSDNIPGVKGVGPKRAATLLSQYDTAFDIHDSLPLDGTAQYIKNLNEFGDQIHTNYQLMDLISYCEDAIGQENIADIKKQLKCEDVQW